MKTVSRSYDSYAQARASVDALEKAGIPSSDVSFMFEAGSMPRRRTLYSSASPVSNPQPMLWAESISISE